MRTHSRAFLPLVFLAPILLAGGRVEAPSFHPEAGTVLTKHFASESELELEDMSLEVDGVDRSDAAGAVEIAMKVSMRLSVVDRYESVGAGRPNKLTRTFEELYSNTHVSGTNPMVGQEEKDIPLSSLLEGSTVVFTWDEGDGSYRTSFDGEGDEDLLEDLKEDIDLRGFLPSGEVSVGDTWEISAEAVRAALAPGGDVKLRPDTEGSPMGGMDQFSQNDLIGELDGQFQGTYAGTRDEDGTKVAVIQLTIEANSAQDMTSKLGEIKEQMESQLPEGIEFEVSAMDGEYEFDAEGELLWNMETGLIYSLNLSGETRMILDMSMSMKMGDQEQSMDLSQTFSGTQTMSMTVGD